jgi:hypothetical protein
MGTPAEFWVATLIARTENSSPKKSRQNQMVARLKRKIRITIAREAQSE